MRCTTRRTGESVDKNGKERLGGNKQRSRMNLGNYSLLLSLFDVSDSFDSRDVWSYGIEISTRRFVKCKFLKIIT